MDFDITCKLSPDETICMKCQSLVSGRNKDIFGNMVKIIGGCRRTCRLKSCRSSQLLLRVMELYRTAIICIC